MRPFVGVGVAVIKDEKILFGKRKGIHGQGFWAFPGGHLEFGESVETCALRELREETGLQARSVRLGPWTENVIESKHYVTIFVLVDEFIGEPQLCEPEKCEGWFWFTEDSLPMPVFPPCESLRQLLCNNPKLNGSLVSGIKEIFF